MKKHRKKKQPLEKLRELNRLLFKGASRKQIIEAVGSDTGFKNYTGIGNNASGINNGDYWPNKFAKKYDSGKFKPIEQYKEDGETRFRYSTEARKIGFNLFSFAMPEDEADEIILTQELINTLRLYNSSITISKPRKLAQNLIIDLEKMIKCRANKQQTQSCEDLKSIRDILAPIDNINRFRNKYNNDEDFNNALSDFFNDVSVKTIMVNHFRSDLHSKAKKY